MCHGGQFQDLQDRSVSDPTSRAPGPIQQTKDQHKHDQTMATTVPRPQPAPSMLERKLKTHRTSKTALVVGGVVLGVGLIYVLTRLVADLAGTHPSSIYPYMLLGLALLIALGFEFVNGFHDTANAVATVIYTLARAAHCGGVVRVLEL